jgi:glycosyltransferase involved in cell wall biosynthesis
VPVIQTTNGWIKKILESEDCGFTIDANSPNELLGKLQYLKENKDRQKEMGENAKRLSMEVFDVNILSNKMLESLIQVYEKK